MNEKIFAIIFKINDSLPVAGGAGAAYTQVKQFPYLPTWEAIISAVIITVIGAVIGYGVKLLLDVIFCKIKKKYGI